MNLGRYEIETYYVVSKGQTETRQRITYTSLNGEDIFIERYYGNIRDGYSGSSTFFKNLYWTNIKSHIVGESIVINDNNIPARPQIYLNISNIESIMKDGLRLTLVEQIEPITLEFVSEFDCIQAYSLLNMVLQNSMIDLNSVVSDMIPPTIFFNEFFFGEYIKIDGSDLTGPFSTEDGNIFRVDINMNEFLGPNPITKNDIVDGLIYDITDNRDGGVSLTVDDITIYKGVVSPDCVVNEIDEIGVYLCKFHLHDLGQNQNNSTIVITVV